MKKKPALKLVEVHVTKKKIVQRRPGDHHGDINLLGIPIQVIVTSPAEINDDKILTDAEHASFDLGTNSILLHEESNGESEARNHHTCHELVHGWFGLTGLRYYLRTQLRMTVEEFEKVEEVAVRMLTPAVMSSTPSLAALMRKPVKKRKKK